MIRPSIAATFVILLASAATAQEAGPRAPEEMAAEFSEAYLDALGSSGVDADVTYFDPEAPAPPFIIDEDPPPKAEAPVEPGRGFSGGIDVTLALALATLAGLVFVVFRLSGGSALSISKMEREGRVRRREAKPLTRTREDLRPIALAEIAAMKDRKLALIALARVALDRVIAAHGITMRESWTSRDALRRIPRAQRLLPELWQLVVAAERAQFGDVHVGEAEFETHLDIAGRLLAETAT